MISNAMSQSSKTRRFSIKNLYQSSFNLLNKCTRDLHLLV